MPVISRFLGIVIAMFYQDHNPPHFHVRYNNYKAIISINNLALMEGSLPPRALNLVMEWANLHKEELMENWELAANLATLKTIKPLE